MAGIEDLLKIQQSELFSPVDRLDAPKFDPAENRKKLAANPLVQLLNPVKKIKLAGTAIKAAANYVAPDLVKSVARKTGQLVDEFYTPEAKLILDKGKDLTSKTKPEKTGVFQSSKITSEINDELLSYYKQGITSPSMLNRLIDGKISTTGIDKFLKKNNLKVEPTDVFKRKLQPIIKENNIIFPNKKIEKEYLKDLKTLSSLERQGIKSDTMYTKSYFQEKYFPFTKNIKSIDAYHKIARNQFGIDSRLIKSSEEALSKSQRRRKIISEISDVNIERQLAGNINFNFHHGLSKRFYASTSDTLYVEGSKNRGPIRATEIKLDALYDAREALVKKFVETGKKPEGYVKKLIKINKEGVKLVEDPKVTGTLNFQIFDPQKLTFHNYGIDITKTLKGMSKIDKNIKDLNVKDIQNLQKYRPKKNGGRVGFEKGGRVQINPEDYVEHYSDGTKLYKYKSFFRDITKII